MRRTRFSKQTLVFAMPVCLILLMIIAVSFAGNKTVKVLTLPDLSNWETEEFSGKTSYELVTIDNRQAIKAISNQSASGLVRKMKVDLTKTPYLNWSWKVDSILSDVNETQKEGDDYAARIYVVISGGIFFWRTRAISYAWASKQPKNSHWPNAFTGNATMVAMQSGPALTGQWVTEKRNVLEDIEKLLDIDKTQIDAIAIMTDTDNSKQSATAYYGDIYFTAQ
ncbi:DUF3047 domain-containing protein [Kaarinaea lacus]